MLDRLLYADLKTYLVELLMKQDQMSMAASIESRVPFLDHKLVEFAARAAAAAEAARLHHQVDPPRGGAVDPAGRDPDAPEDGLPGAVRRSGCAAGGTTSRATSCSTRAARQRGIIDAAGGRAACSRRTRRGAADGGDAIWSLLNLELWYRTFIDGDGVQTLPDVDGLAAAARRAAGDRLGDAT